MILAPPLTLACQLGLRDGKLLLGSGILLGLSDAAEAALGNPETFFLPPLDDVIVHVFAGVHPCSMRSPCSKGYKVMDAPNTAV